MKAGLALLAVLLSVEVAAEGAPVPTGIAPGGVAVWQPTAEGCRVGDDLLPELGGRCWFPVDLLTPPGTRWAVETAGGTKTLEVAAYPYPEQHIQLDDERMVSPDAAALERIAGENARIRALWPLRTPARFTLPLAPPLADLPAGGRFGSRRVFNGQPRNPHSGADFSAPRGTPVLAMAPGRVVLAEDHYFAGKSVFIDHGDGLITMSFHLDEIRVTRGAEVTTGTTIGTVGASGRATGPHLHVGVRWRGARVDPAILMDPRRVVELDQVVPSESTPE